MTSECGDEGGHVLAALHPAEAALGVEHPGGGPALDRLAVTPALDVAVRAATEPPWVGWRLQ